MLFFFFFFFLADRIKIEQNAEPSFSTSFIGWSRKYPYPYYGRHLGIPTGEGGLRRLEFRRGGGFTSTGIPWTWGGGHWTGIPKAYGGFQESNFQFVVVKSLQEKLVKNDLSKDDDSETRRDTFNSINTPETHFSGHGQ